MSFITRCTVFYFFALLFLPAFVSQAYADQDTASLEQIAHASMEDLLHMTVTTVSRSPEELQKVPAAVFVLTGEDIKRSGVTSVPDALRLVPGVEVASTDNNKWAVSIRGFASPLTNNLLVMIDGRSIYDPAFSGTLWEIRDVMLEDIDRIEVIRGPGGSVWGENAANGVINIITKNAAETQGILASAGYGNIERDFEDVRYGGKIMDSTFYRLYGRFFQRENGYLSQGVSDDSYNGQGGFRTDSALDDEDKLMLEANVFTGDHDGVQPLDNVFGRGGSAQGEWDREISSEQHLVTHFWYSRDDVNASVLAEKRDTMQLDSQHQYQATDRFKLISQFQYTYSHDHITNSEEFGVDPSHRGETLVSAGVEGQYQLIKDVLELRGGSKVEHNDYTNWEAEPDVALSWLVTPDDTIWSSISRAVRVPSRLENDLVVFEPPTDVPVQIGNRHLDAEQLIAYEVGYRSTVNETFSYDLTSFYNNYDKLIISDPTTFENDAHGYTYGAEASAVYRPFAWWQIRPAYTFLKTDFKLNAGVDDPAADIEALEGPNPENQASVRLQFDVDSTKRFDCDVRYVDNLGAPHISSYVVADARAAYQITDSVELAVVGQNLFRAHHYEWAGGSEVPEGVYGQVTWRY